jgi:hypothetical protein
MFVNAHDAFARRKAQRMLLLEKNNGQVRVSIAVFTAIKDRKSAP